MDTPALNRAARLNSHEKPAPLDLSHHYSVVTKRRVPSKLKEAYKFFQIPGILNIAGGSYPLSQSPIYALSVSHSLAL
jgi:hypothetical protein